jgi:hypothetical protein
LKLEVGVVVVGGGRCRRFSGDDDGSSNEVTKETRVVCLWLMMTKHFPPAKVELSRNYLHRLHNNDNE